VGKRAAAFKTRSRVIFDNEASTTSTWSRSRAWTGRAALRNHAGAVRHGARITSSIVATYGELAVDVFYIRDIFGHKVIHPSASPRSKPG